MKKSFIKTIGLILMTLFVSVSVHAQVGFEEEDGGEGGGGGSVGLYGSTSVYQNDVKTYTAIPGPGLTIYSAYWSVFGGIIQSQSNTSVTILWNNIGLKTINFEVINSNQGEVLADLPVYVSAAAAPATPSTPTISSNTRIQKISCPTVQRSSLKWVLDKRGMANKAIKTPKNELIPYPRHASHSATFIS